MLEIGQATNTNSLIDIILKFKWIILLFIFLPILARTFGNFLHKNKIKKAEKKQKNFLELLEKNFITWITKIKNIKIDDFSNFSEIEQRKLFKDYGNSLIIKNSGLDNPVLPKLQLEIPKLLLKKIEKEFYS